MDKTRFIEQIRVGRTQWETFLAQIDESRMSLPGAAGKWSVKDIIAHIMWSEHEMIGVCQTHTLTGSDLWNLSEDERNEAVFVEYRDRSLSELLVEEQAVFAQLFAAVQTLSEEDLHDPHRFRDMPSEWIPWQVIAGCSFEHYQSHTPSIQAWLEQKS